MIVLVFLFTLVAFLCVPRSEANANRVALVVTLAGDHKLAEYFEWSCQSISWSSLLVDMIVVHEGNKKLSTAKCGENVLFVDLGDGGLSKLIVNTVLKESSVKDDVRTQLSQMLNSLFIHSPQYLVEIKPMIGTLFREHLKSYSHWSYTDPDILWGNLSNWLSSEDLSTFEIISFAKNWDAGRLFLRGQLSIHKNIDFLNNLWKKLDYFAPDSYASRIGGAFHLLSKKATTDEIFGKFFNSAEGWYSKIAFDTPAVNIKIVGRGFDDYFSEPVLLINGKLGRCNLVQNLSSCIEKAIMEADRSVTEIAVHQPAQYIDALTEQDPTICKMFWLPAEVRLCIVDDLYAKEKALVQDAHSRKKLKRVGEVIRINGNWSMNDEEKSRRQDISTAALFHFRQWDDVVCKGVSSNLGKSSALLAPLAASQSAITGKEQTQCSIMHISRDRILTLEECGVAIAKERLAVQLQAAAAASASLATTDKSQQARAVSPQKMLQDQRKHKEIGISAASHRSRKRRVPKAKSSTDGSGEAEGVKKKLRGSSV